jgi:DNA-directed RNA polymerase specialized sigma24 family protein
MSAAMTLPYVWATASEASMRSKEASKPIGGLIFYRRRTESLLRRYLRASLAVGRVPSVAEDMTLRGRATSYRMKNFEDVVIFSIDVERCLKSLETQARQLVVKIAIQEYMFLEAAEQMGLDPRTVARRYGDALDQLTAEFLKKKLLTEDEEK